MTQSGRDSTVPVILASPQGGIHFTCLIASSARPRNASMRMKNCLTARKTIGVFDRQQQAAFAEKGDDLGIGVENILAGQPRHLCLISKPAFVVDWRKNRQSAFL